MMMRFLRYVDAVRNLGPEASGILGAANASKLITDLEERYGHVRLFEQ